MQKTSGSYAAHYNLPCARRGFITVVHIAAKIRKLIPIIMKGIRLMVLYHFYSRKVAKVAKPLIIFKNLPPLRNVFQTEILPGE
jgi:hypothetical protein